MAGLRSCVDCPVVDDRIRLYNVHVTCRRAFFEILYRTVATSFDIRSIEPLIDTMRTVIRIDFPAPVQRVDQLDQSSVVVEDMAIVNEPMTPAGDASSTDHVAIATLTTVQRESDSCDSCASHPSGLPWILTSVKRELTTTMRTHLEHTLPSLGLRELAHSLETRLHGGLVSVFRWGNVGHPHTRSCS